MANLVLVAALLGKARPLHSWTALWEGSAKSRLSQRERRSAINSTLFFVLNMKLPLPFACVNHVDGRLELALASYSTGVRFKALI